MENIPDHSWMYRERGFGVKGLTNQFINGVRCLEERRDSYMLARRWAHSQWLTPSPAPPITQGPPTTTEPSTSQPSSPATPEMDPSALDMEMPLTSHLSSRSGSTGLTALETMCMRFSLLHDQDKDGMGVKGKRPIKAFVGRCSGKKQ
ncbi:hypothetical protein M9H77_18573 [Catharanthus roseus]|uniref:Uncharacterized protein n=1 Tax=Catharanthus roseus TaxID=4058 RepID=A0ACC0B7U3_CATRO|nr:hypothetical protein M9H77_18573 [Catharanthus roseus]